MSKHTPGPWKIVTGKKFDQLVSHSTGGLVATMPDKSAYSTERRDADAALIAAAPELLEALVALVDAIDGMHFTVGDMNQARRAIAKAEGK